jgi:hypothetical protein
LISFRRDAELFRAGHGRHPPATVRARGVLIAVAGRADLLALAASRRLPVA